MTEESARAVLPALALDAVPRWLAAQVQQQITAAGAAGYTPLPLAAVEQLLPEMAQRFNASPTLLRDELAGRFFAALGQTPDLATAFAILSYILLP
jgi:hypothetical protein